MSYGIWDVGRKKWMPDPLLGHMSRRPESFKTRGEAERTADREWRKLNPDDKFEVRPLPSTEESRRTRKPSAHKAGTDYAHEQIGSPYFLEWVHEQMAEAERMRQADPNSVIDASTPAGARKVAKNMLQQLEWDTKRELNMTTVGLEHGDAKAFYEGFAEQLRQTSTVEWLTDIILRTEEDMRGGRRSKLSTTQEAGRYGRRRYGDSDAVIKHKQYEEEWQRKSAEYRAKVEPLKAGLVKINGQDLRSRGLQIPSRDDEILIASLSDPRKGNEPVATSGSIRASGTARTGDWADYLVDPAIVPAGRRRREARRGKVSSMEARRSRLPRLSRRGSRRRHRRARHRRLQPETHPPRPVRRSRHKRHRRRPRRTDVKLDDFPIRSQQRPSLRDWPQD